MCVKKNYINKIILQFFFQNNIFSKVLFDWNWLRAAYSSKHRTFLFYIFPLSEDCFIKDQKLFPKSIKIETVPPWFGVQREKNKPLEVLNAIFTFHIANNIHRYMIICVENFRFRSTRDTSACFLKI